MQECPGSPRGVVNKELISEPQTKDYNNGLALLCVCVCVYVWAFEWVFVCMLEIAQVCVLYMWKGQTGDCSRLIICK